MSHNLEEVNAQLQEELHVLQEDIQTKREQLKRLIQDNAAKGEEVNKLFVKRMEFKNTR